MNSPLYPLPADEVHVWRIDLGRVVAEVEQLSRLLSPNEAARAGRFKFRVDRDHFIAGRAVLRQISGRYLGTGPSNLVFSYGPQGKPSLADNPHDLRFNLTHSHGLMLCAVGRSRELGIDLEHLRDDIDFGDIAQRFFAPQEIATLRAVPTYMKKRAFFTCWVRKEAYIKACGQGLSLPLDKFTVPILDTEPMRLRSESAPLEKWSLTPLSTEAGYVAALVAEGHPHILEVKDWHEVS